MRFGSLFAGIGGLDLGLERAGMTCAFQVEIDPFCRRVLEKHWPDVPRFGDIREVQAHDLPSIDLLAGGFPCQPHSTAGRRLGSDDERDLWGEYVRIIEGTQPSWIVAENVVGLLTTEGGRFFGRVLRDLAQLGYDASWSTVSACSLGSPHPRNRLFLVAYRDGLHGEAWLGRIGQHEAIQHGRDGESSSPWLATVAPSGRVAHGFSDWLDRVKGAGNAVVPYVAEWIGRRIMEVTA